MAIPTVLTRSDRKTLAVSVTKDGKVIVKAPLFLPLTEINSFLSEKQKWIVDKLAFVNNSLTQNSDIVNFEKFLFLGQKYKPFQADVNSFVFDEENRLLVPKFLNQNEVIGAVVKHYKKMAKRVLIERVNTVAESIGSFPKQIKISNAKGRWGSCSSGKTISLNWRLLLVEPKIVDYVIVHELSHLVELNHSEQFWNKVSKIVPDHSILRKHLSDQSYLLTMFR